MEGQDSEAMNGLSDRQLASISDTLLRASQRRDAEVQKRTASANHSSPPVAQSLRPSCNSPLPNSVTKDGYSDFATSVVSGSRQTLCKHSGFHNLNLDLRRPSIILNNGIDPSPLPTEHFSNEEDCKSIFAHPRHPDHTSDGCDTPDSKQMAAHHAYGTFPTGSKGAPNRLTMFSDTVGSGSVEDSSSSSCDVDIDTKKALADFNRNLSAEECTFRNEIDDLNPKTQLAMVEGKYTGLDEVTGCEDTGDDPKRLLTELDGNDSIGTQEGETGEVESPPAGANGRPISDAGIQSLLVQLPTFSPVVSQPSPAMDAAGPVKSHIGLEWQARFMELTDNLEVSSTQATPAVASDFGATIDEARAMIAELERNTSFIKQRPAEDDEDSIDALYRRLTGVLVPVAEPEDPETNTVDAQSDYGSGTGKCMTDVEKPVIPYIIALQLEMAGCKWEKVMGWTTYLFSKGPYGHEAQREKQKVTDHTSAELDILIEHSSHENEHHAEAEECRLARRLIVSNIATDALEEDLREFFNQLGFDLQEVKVVPGQDVVKRTKIAYVDMFTREAAIHASFATGHIFGLILDIKLAVESED